MRAHVGQRVLGVRSPHGWPGSPRQGLSAMCLTVVVGAERCAGGWRLPGTALVWRGRLVVWGPGSGALPGRASGVSWLRGHFCPIHMGVLHPFDLHRKLRAFGR